MGSGNFLGKTDNLLSEALPAIYLAFGEKGQSHYVRHIMMHEQERYFAL